MDRQNVGAGWWEGAKGDILGLFPQEYVLQIDPSEVRDFSLFVIAMLKLPPQIPPLLDTKSWRILVRVKGSRTLSRM